MIYSSQDRVKGRIVSFNSIYFTHISRRNASVYRQIRISFVFVTELLSLCQRSQPRGSDAEILVK